MRLLLLLLLLSAHELFVVSIKRVVQLLIHLSIFWHRFAILSFEGSTAALHTFVFTEVGRYKQSRALWRVVDALTHMVPLKQIMSEFCRDGAHLLSHSSYLAYFVDALQIWQWQVVTLVLPLQKRYY